MQFFTIDMEVFSFALKHLWYRTVSVNRKYIFQLGEPHGRNGIR